jgi:hypothetical protein
MTINPKVIDHAKNILMAAGMLHNLDEATAADLYDIYYSVRSSAELAEKLAPLDKVPTALKHQLVVAFKQFRDKPSPAQSAMDRVFAAIHTIGSKKLPMAHVEAGEKHKNVMKALTDAALLEHDEEK